MIFDLMFAASYLNCKGLLNITCKKVADYIKDFQPEEVRQIFNIENGYSEEEEAQVRKENEWAFHWCWKLKTFLVFWIVYDLVCLSFRLSEWF